MIADYQQLAIDLTRDDGAKIAVAERDRAITAAILRYSTDRPRDKVQDVTPETSQLLPLPAAWEDGFSVLLNLEHPIGQVPPAFIGQDRYALYQSPAGFKVQLVDGVAVAANSVRATYTIKHQVDAGVDTIPLQYREPVSCWAAAMLCDQLAAYYSSGTDASIQADSVQQQSKAQEYSARARALRKRYLDELGVEEKKSAPAGTVVNLDLNDSRGQDRLMHGNAYR